MNPETITLILKLVDLIATAVIRAPEVKIRFDELRSEISLMVAEGRNPTPAEWDAMNDRADALHAELQGSD